MSGLNAVLPQLHVYAYLVEERTGQQGQQDEPVLYRRGKRRPDNYISVYENSRDGCTIAVFDETVHKIMRKEFSHRAESPGRLQKAVTCFTVENNKLEE